MNYGLERGPGVLVPQPHVECISTRFINTCTNRPDKAEQKPCIYHGNEKFPFPRMHTIFSNCQEVKELGQCHDTVQNFDGYSFKTFIAHCCGRINVLGQQSTDPIKHSLFQDTQILLVQSLFFTLFNSKAAPMDTENMP